MPPDHVRILFLSHRFPYPPTFGSKVRAFNAIRHLSREHEVSVFSLVRSADEERDAQGIAPHCFEHQAFRVSQSLQAAKLAATLPTTISASEAYFHSGPMQREIDRRLARRSFDFIFAHCSSVGRYVEHVEGLPKLMDFCDVDSRKWLDYVAFKPWPASLGYHWEGWRVARAERRLARRFDVCTVTTAGEARTLLEGGVRGDVDWFANGVDLAYFQPSAQPYDPDQIAFVGRMDYFPNEQCMVRFCADAWPLLKRRRPGLKLQIVGASPTPAVQALARHEGVSVTGSVPDVRPYVQRCALTVTPLLIARGTQNKIIESMAMGVPVVASGMAAAGVDAVPGEHLLAADGPQATCDAILSLLEDPAARARLAAAGRARVESHHSWDGSLRRLDAAMSRCSRRVPVLQAA